MDKNSMTTLIERRSVVISLLRSLTTQLRTVDQPPISQSEEAEGLTASTQQKHAALRRASKELQQLSWRGIEKSLELFELFDVDRDGALSYSEFRGYLVAVGRPDEIDAHVLSNREAWQCYIYDLYGTTDAGLLGPDGFCMYRAAIEHTHPLEDDLLRVGIDLLPKSLAQWEKNQHSFDRLDTENPEEDENGGLVAGRVPVAQMQQLIADCGEVLTDEEVTLALHAHLGHNALMGEVREYYASRNEFAYHQVSLVDGTDRDHLYRDAFLAWWMSPRPKPVIREFESRLCHLKLMLKRGIRNTIAALRHARTSITSLVDRGLVTEPNLTKIKQEQSRYDATLEIGDADGMEEGFVATLNFAVIENPTQSFIAMHLPGGIGSVLTIDLLQRSDLEEGVVSNACKNIEAVIEEHFKSELEKIPYFHSWRVVACRNDWDNVPVVRVALCLKPESSIDYHLKKQLGLGVGLSEILADLNCDFRCSVNIVDLLESKKMVLDDEFSCRLALSGTVARKMITKIAEELFMTTEEAHKYSEADQAERKAAHLEAQKRTLLSHGAFLNPGDPLEVGITGFKEEERRKTDAQKAAEKRSYAVWAQRAWRLLGTLRGVKAMTFEYRFDNLSHLMFGNKLVLSQLPMWVTDQLTKGAGFVANRFQSLCARFDSEVTGAWNMITDRETQEKLWEEQAEQARRAAEATMSAAERRRLQFLEEKKRLQEKLMGMGINVQEGDLGNDDEGGTDPVEMMRKTKLEQIKSERKMLEMHHACWRAFVGVHSVMLQSGQNRFQLSLQGLDLWEVCPEPDDPPAECTAAGGRK